MALGRFTLDAVGSVLNGQATVNLNGAISSEVFSGTTTLNADCTGSANVDLFDLSGNKIATITTELVFLDHMREAREIFTSVVLANGTPLMTVITLEAKKLSVYGTLVDLGCLALMWKGGRSNRTGRCLPAFARE